VQDLLFEVPKLQRQKVEKRVRHFEARPTSRPFFENFENGSLKFQFFLNKILDIGNDVFYERANYQFEIPSILGSEIIKNMEI
jgi:hypothetical protein